MGSPHWLLLLLLPPPKALRSLGAQSICEALNPQDRPWFPETNKRHSPGGTMVTRPCIVAVALWFMTSSFRALRARHTPFNNCLFRMRDFRHELEI